MSKGDIVVLGVNTDNKNNSCSLNESDDYDNIFLVSFKDIGIGEEILITDNRYNSNNNFGNTEGWLKFKKVNSILEAGTVFRLDIKYNSYVKNTVQNGWELTETGGNFGLNVGGDQLFILNKGNWSKGNYKGLEAQLLFGYNTMNLWSNNSGSSNTILPGTNTSNYNNNFDIRSYHFTPKEGNKRYRFYDGKTTPTSKNEWFIRLVNPNNWKSFEDGDCSSFISHSQKNELQKFEIIKQLNEFQKCVNETIPLSIDLDNSTHSIQTNYEWFRVVTPTNIGGTFIGTGRKFNYIETTAGTYYYYCKITYRLEWNNITANKTNVVNSGYIKVKVNPLPKTSPIKENIQ
ncbi:hypothetical protein [Empedobacter brevis]|uniref:hypothetical protein n=1 Tax=Empedobacter brevis TaxID=247 RepID=UPI0039B00D0A